MSKRPSKKSRSKSREPEKSPKKPRERSKSREKIKKPKAKVVAKEVKTGDQKIYRSNLNVLMNSNKVDINKEIFREAVIFIYENITDFLILVRAEGTLDSSLIEAKTEYNFEIGPKNGKYHSHGTILTTQKSGMIHLDTKKVRQFMDKCVGSIYLRVWAMKTNTANENYLRK